MLQDNIQEELITVAYRSIQHGIANKTPWIPDINEYAGILHEPRAVFVTLKKSGRLRGCIGTLIADNPLVVNVAKHAYNAAFNDPRFKKLIISELAEIDIHISILTPEQEIVFTDETDLINKLNPGIDGLTIKKGACKATFLPSVWESITEPEQFLHQLKLKAKINPDDSPESAWCYQAESIAEKN